MITISLYLKTIDDSLLRTAIDEVYNVWFNYWKKMDSKDITQSLVNKCINERGTIYSKYQDYPVVHALLKALGDELEARWFGGYKTEKLTEGFNEGFEKTL